jgi:Tfp pilus assembly protein PilF
MPQIGANLIRARIAQSQNQNAQAIMSLRQAVALQDSMDYNEPPDWIIPTREWLGAVLLKDGKPVEAERVFREQLERTPRSGRSLFGLAQALKAQNRNDDAIYVQQQYEAAWKNADSPLRMADLIVQERGVQAQRR